MAHYRNTSSTSSSQPCPACGQGNRPGSRFCNQCGSPLAHGQAGTPDANQSPPRQADQHQEWQRQRQWLWQEEQRLLSHIAAEQAQYASIEMALGLLHQQKNWQQTQQRTQVVGNIVVSGLLGLQRTLAEQNYLYAFRLLEQEILRHQFQLVQCSTRMEALKANLSRIQTEALRVDALLQK